MITQPTQDTPMDNKPSEYMVRAANEVFNNTGTIVKRLRLLAKDQEDNAAFYLVLTDAATEIELLTAHIERLEAWQQEGDVVFRDNRPLSPMFNLGSWWADRPWRKRA